MVMFTIDVVFIYIQCCVFLGFVGDEAQEANQVILDTIQIFGE